METIARFLLSGAIQNRRTSIIWLMNNISIPTQLSVVDAMAMATVHAAVKMAGLTWVGLNLTKIHAAGTAVMGYVLAAKEQAG